MHVCVLVACSCHSFCVSCRPSRRVWSGAIASVLTRLAAVRVRASSPLEGTVSASILGSFDFVVAFFTPPAKAPVMLAAARERLVDAPHGTSPHRRVEGMVTFAATMPQRNDAALLVTTVSGVPIQPSLPTCRARRSARPH